MLGIMAFEADIVASDKHCVVKDSEEGYRY